MLLENKGRCALQHDNYLLLPGMHLDVPDKIAKLWLNYKGIVEYADPAQVKKEQEKLENENKQLKKELNKLKEVSKSKKNK